MMNIEAVFGQQLTVWVVIPVLIFLARVLDVSIGTMRVIFITRGMRLLAPLVGFFEVLIWLIVIGEVLSNLTHWVNYVAYAAGFAAGNYVGMVIEHRMALGKAIVRVITRVDAEILTENLRKHKILLTVLDAAGNNGPVKVLFMVVARTQLPFVLDLVNEYNPRAVYTIEDVRFVSEGLSPMPEVKRRRFVKIWRWLNRISK